MCIHVCVCVGGEYFTTHRCCTESPGAAFIVTSLRLGSFEPPPSLFYSSVIPLFLFWVLVDKNQVGFTQRDPSDLLLLSASYYRIYKANTCENQRLCNQIGTDWVPARRYFKRAEAEILPAAEF